MCRRPLLLLVDPPEEPLIDQGQHPQGRDLQPQGVQDVQKLVECPDAIGADQVLITDKVFPSRSKKAAGSWPSTSVTMLVRSAAELAPLLPAGKLAVVGRGDHQNEPDPAHARFLAITLSKCMSSNAPTASITHGRHGIPALMGDARLQLPGTGERTRVAWSRTRSRKQRDSRCTGEEMVEGRLGANLSETALGGAQPDGNNDVLAVDEDQHQIANLFAPSRGKGELTVLRETTQRMVPN